MNSMQIIMMAALTRNRSSEEKMLYAIQGGMQPKIPSLNMINVVAVKKQIDQLQETEQDRDKEKTENKNSKISFKAMVDAIGLILSKVSETEFKKALNDAENAQILQVQKDNFEVWKPKIVEIRALSLQSKSPAKEDMAKLIPAAKLSVFFNLVK